MEIKKEPNKHLTYDERNFIEIGLNNGRNFAQIANDLNINAKNFGIEYCSSDGLMNNKIKNNVFQLKPKYLYNFWIKFIIIKGIQHSMRIQKSKTITQLVG